MLSDWYRATKDPDIRHLKIVQLLDNLQRHLGTAANKGWQAAAKAVTTLKWLLAGLARVFAVAIVVTVVAGVLWLVVGDKSVALSQALIIVPGALWTAFLVLVSLVLGTVEGLVNRNLQGLKEQLEEVKESVLRRLRLPAIVALGAIILTIAVSRLPQLRSDPHLLLILLAAVAGFVLVAFLGLSQAGLTWMKRAVVIQLFLTMFALVIVPLFPNLFSRVVALPPAIDESFKPPPPEPAMFDLSNPPAPFDSLGKPLFSYTTDEVGDFRLWKKPTDSRVRDPQNRKELKLVDTPEIWTGILAALRQRELRQTALPVAKVTERPSGRRPTPIIVEDPDQIEFVDVLTGTNRVWFFRSEDGSFSLYDAPGFHRSGGQLQPADNAAVRDEIRTWFVGRRELTESPPTIIAAAPAEDPPATAPVIAPLIREFTPERPEQIPYSASARRVLAEELLGMDETTLNAGFAIDCTKLTFEQPATVKASFRLARRTDGNGQVSLSRVFQVVEKFTVLEYQGLTDEKTVNRIVSAFRKQIENDSQVLVLLRSGSR